MSTSAKSKSSTKRRKADPARPFRPEVLKQAKALAAQYQVVLRFDEEAGEFYGRGLELPLCMGDGITADACLAHTRAAFVAVVATMLEEKQQPPVPAVVAQQKRTEQVNLRLTVEEKNRLEHASRRDGFEGISDFVRNAALAVAK